ncbi:hypothetical protein PUMCH_003527 [Australozyma saopauloensis]|uniref:Uncharacterized protein n=1 Tax=Australozyma saopauloensis TaxID=291208 RepID=A0AAX4HD07_9ASCO|nr:hypothetical protein PUMCH_003527 [[Candida] saopauloensis]
MNLFFLVKFFTLINFVTAFGFKKDKKTLSLPSVDFEPMVVKVDAIRLVPLHLVVDSYIPSGAHLIPLNPSDEDLMSMETYGTESANELDDFHLAAPAEVAQLPGDSVSATEVAKLADLGAPGQGLADIGAHVYHHAVFVTPQPDLSIDFTSSFAMMVTTTTSATGQPGLANENELRILGALSNKGVRKWDPTGPICIVLFVMSVAFLSLM